MSAKVEVFDNGGDTLDRYTVFYPDGDARGMSKDPFSRFGFCQWVEADYDHVWARDTLVPFDELPEDVQRAIDLDLEEWYT